MARAEKQHGPKGRRQKGDTEHQFTIDAYTPETIPMARLAEYMRELSQMLGEPASVHFLRVEPGSTVIVHRVEREAIPKIRERILLVKNGDGPAEGMRAYNAINKLLRDDNAVGAYRGHKGSAVILKFPGRERIEERFSTIRQQGFIDGIVTGIRGRDETVHITLDSEGKQISGCYTNRAIAKQLGSKLYEAVRLFGKGKWFRDAEGTWGLSDFKVESFEPLQEVLLTDALGRLRAIPAEWGDEAFRELELIRKGTKGSSNGGH